MAGKPQVASEKPQFDDADYEDFYGQALTWAREVGVVNGWDGTNDFAPDMEVSREQLAKMIANYANKIAGANTVADSRTWTSSMTRTRSRLGRAMRLPGAPRRAF